MLKRFLLLIGLLPLLGCQEEPKISVREAPRAGAMYRFLGAVLFPNEEAKSDKIWFFSVAGPEQKIREAMPTFDKFIRSVKILPENKASWTLPTGWTEEEGKGPFLYATVYLGSKDLGMKVTPLGKEASSIDANVDRWRREIGLASIGLVGLDEFYHEEQTPQGKLVWVDMLGPSPRKSGGPMKMPVHQDPPEPKEEPAGPAPFKYETPEGWKRAPNAPLSTLTFAVGEGAKPAMFTTTPLAAGGAGGVEQNVNRWRGQIGLQPLTGDALAKEVTELPVAGKKAQLVDLVGQERRILGAILNTEDATWFFKLTGPVEVVGQNKVAFSKFLESISFDKR